MPDSSFRLLHLSDLHAGLAGQNLLWSNLKEVLFNDLKVLHDQLGGWNAVLFSGDFAQKGSDAEFDEVILRLQDLWNNFDELGLEPLLICIPGNHDVERPDAKKSAVKILKKWFEEREIWEEFFNNDADEYRSVVSQSFEAYERFIQRISKSSIPLASQTSGKLPGDQLVELGNSSVSVGVMGLNSTWLQLSGDEYRGQLCVDLHQAHALEPELGRWCARHDFNIITTHHPTDWLHSSSLEVWNSEINPPGRFDIHLFGHMHEPFSQSIATSGAAGRHSMQAPSLFGMELMADGSRSRIHGYSLLSFERHGDGRRIKVFPRRLKGHRSGQQRFIPDSDFVLKEDRYFEIDLQGKPKTLSAPISESSEKTFVAAEPDTEEKDVLRPLRYHLSRAAAHDRVRAAERKHLLEILESRRAVWLTSEWGLGSDEFLASALAHAPRMRVFRVDASEYADRDGFSADVARKLGCSFPQVTDALTSEPTLVIFDDVPTGMEPTPGAPAIEDDILNLVEVILDACPTAWVVLRCHRKPRDNGLTVIQLSPLDEADVKLYIGDHEGGGERLTTPDAIEILFRHSEGYPSRINTHLKELAVVAIEELSSDDHDVEERSHLTAPPTLVRAINDLVVATDKPIRRMFDLLKALMVFPQGAELGQIKRFNGVHPFHPSDAVGLLDRSLITVSETPDVGYAKGSSPQKILVVPRPIRDYIRTLVDDTTVNSLTMKAASLLFGSEWMSGSKDWPKDFDYSKQTCGVAEIANASALLLRLFRTYRSDPSSREAAAVASLSVSFANALYDGSHYSSCATFCRDVVGLMDADYFPEKRANLLVHYGSALRMLGEREKAKELLREAIEFPFPKLVRQDALLTLALCHEKDGEPEAVDYAKEVLRINRTNSPGYQAQAILIEATTEGAERKRKLEAFEKLMRSKKKFVLANNIALTLAEETSDEEEAVALISSVLKGPKHNKEFYNKTRAVLRLIERKVKAGVALSDLEIEQLIRCYQFLLRERVAWMFDSCHWALWQAFSERGNWANLLTLFRYSSMIWRLRGDEERERRFLVMLERELRPVPQERLRENRQSHYYRARAMQVGSGTASQPLVMA